MGYAGVHLSGIETHELLRHTIEVADELEQESPTSADWRNPPRQRLIPYPIVVLQRLVRPTDYISLETKATAGELQLILIIPVGVTASEQELRKT